MWQYRLELMELLTGRSIVQNMGRAEATEDARELARSRRTGYCNGVGRRPPRF
jgi:hypothetical protein